MKVYKITNLEIDSAEYLEGYNVHEYFDHIGDIRELYFPSAAAAQKFAADNYKGADEYGIGVTWEIEAEDLTDDLASELGDHLSYEATTDEDWDTDEDGEPVCRTTTTVHLLLDGEAIAEGEARGYYSICYTGGERFSAWQDSEGPERDNEWDAIAKILVAAGIVDDLDDVIDPPAEPVEPVEDATGGYILLYHGWEQPWTVRGRYANQEDAHRALVIAQRATKEANSPGSYGWDFAVAILDEDGDEEVDGLRVTILTDEE